MNLKEILFHCNGYEVLFYGAWQQTGLDESKAFKININTLDNIHSSKSENTIDGDFKVILARYLHFYGDLKYTRKPIENTKTIIIKIKTVN